MNVHSPFTEIESAIEEIRAGRMIVVVDDEDRENEGDLTIAAETITPEAVNFMAKEGRGAIVNIASLMAIKPGFGNANYAASKAGLIALTKAAAKELGRFHITVNAILPGFHETEMASGLSAEHKKKVIADHVIGRSTRIEDLCRMVLEVTQNPSVSGQVFNVDSRVV